MERWPNALRVATCSVLTGGIVAAVYAFFTAAGAAGRELLDDANDGDWNLARAVAAGVRSIRDDYAPENGRIDLDRWALLVLLFILAATGTPVWTATAARLRELPQPPWAYRVAGTQLALCFLIGAAGFFPGGTAASIVAGVLVWLGGFGGSALVVAELSKRNVGPYRRGPGVAPRRRAGGT